MTVGFFFSPNGSFKQGIYLRGARSGLLPSSEVQPRKYCLKMHRGARNTSVVSDGRVCQICESQDHLAPKCPYLYTRCKIQGCVGIRILKEANTEMNKGRKFLKCQHISCAGFQWLDSAIEEFKGSMGSSNISTYNLQGCFLCGCSGHWKVDCPWSATMCHNCQGTVSLKVSGKPETQGKRYLKCGKCGYFKWFAPMDKPTTSTSAVKMTLEGSLDDLCNMFQNSCTHK